MIIKDNQLHFLFCELSDESQERAIKDYIKTWNEEDHDEDSRPMEWDEAASNCDTDEAFYNDKGEYQVEFSNEHKD